MNTISSAAASGLGAGKSLTHAFKKTLKTVTTAPSTASCDDFEEIKIAFKKTVDRTEAVQSVLKKNKETWDVVRRSVKSSLDVFKASVKEGQSAKDVVNDAADAMAEWESSMRTSGDEYGMSEAAARYVQAEDMLAKYLKLAGDVKTKISKRENYRKELDYYKSKQESLASKSSDSEKERLARAEVKGEQLQALFDAANEEAYGALRHAIALNERVIACAISAYLGLQQTFEALYMHPKSYRKSGGSCRLDSYRFTAPYSQEASSAEAMGQFCDTARASHRATKDEWPCEDEFLIDQIDGLTIVNASPQRQNSMQRANSSSDSGDNVSCSSSSLPSRAPPARPVPPPSCDDFGSNGAVKPARPQPPSASNSVEETRRPQPPSRPLPPASLDDLGSSRSLSLESNPPPSVAPKPVRPQLPSVDSFSSAKSLTDKEETAFTAPAPATSRPVRPAVPSAAELRATRSESLSSEGGAKPAMPVKPPRPQRLSAEEGDSVAGGR